MKTAITALIFAFALSCTAGAYTFDGNTPLTEKQISAIRVNIKNNLTDPSLDIRCSTVQLVMELKEAYPSTDFDYVIIPLVSLLKNDDSPELRILAARALYRFDSEVARYAVSRRALYDPSDRVARNCGTLARSWGQKTPNGDLASSMDR